LYIERMQARVYVTLKPGVLDPQGKAVRSSLATIGFGGVSDVRLGKYLEVTLGETDPAKARAAVEQMCQKLLANTVIESYRIDLLPEPGGAAAQ
jgi:phosphoribosylformylglycinamidine synthase subunit PurS